MTTNNQQDDKMRAEFERELLVFEDFINEPSRNIRPEPSAVCDYRHELYRKWRKLDAEIRKSLASREQPTARMQADIGVAIKALRFYANCKHISSDSMLMLQDSGFEIERGTVAKAALITLQKYKPRIGEV